MIFDSHSDRSKFIESNLGLVKSRVLKLNNNRFSEDLFQVGSLALVIATDNYDESRGVKFASFAVQYIDGDILRYKRFDSVIKPFRKNGQWQYCHNKIISIHKKVNDDDITLEDTICGNDNVEQYVVDNIAINGFLDNLSERDKRVILLTMKGITQSKISSMVGINQSCVSKIVSRSGKQYHKYCAM